MKNFVLMRKVVLAAAGALALAACGAADGTTSADDETTATEGEAIKDLWTPFVSEEQPLGTTCGTTDMVGATRAACTGSYCDNMALFCGTLPAPFVSTGSADSFTWTSFVSEEQPGGVMCPSWGILPRVIDGIRFTGSYGDNVSVHCRGANLGTSADMNCAWTPFFSEEQGTQTFHVSPFSYQTAVAKGVRCSNSYCDNMSFYVCEPKCTSNSQCFNACVNGVCTVG
jgi:hypothetical protein